MIGLGIPWMNIATGQSSHSRAVVRIRFDARMAWLSVGVPTPGIALVIATMGGHFAGIWAWVTNGRIRRMMRGVDSRGTAQQRTLSRATWAKLVATSMITHSERGAPS